MKKSEFIIGGDYVLLKRGSNTILHRLRKPPSADLSGGVRNQEIVKIGQDMVDVSSLTDGSIPFESSFILQQQQDNTKTNIDDVSHKDKHSKKSNRKTVWSLKNCQGLEAYRKTILMDGNGGHNGSTECQEGSDLDVTQRDNRNMVDGQMTNIVTSEQIDEMRNAGASGSDIMGAVIENSDTFHIRTQFSQEKFVKKKNKKYSDYVSVHRVNLRRLHHMNYERDPLRIMNLRPDTLAQMLNCASVRGGGRYMVYDNDLQGLPVAACLDRLVNRSASHADECERGQVYHVYKTTSINHQILRACSFDKTFLDKHLFTINAHDLHKLDGVLVAAKEDVMVDRSGEPEAGNHSANNASLHFMSERAEESHAQLMSSGDEDGCGVDGLLIFTRQNACEILLWLLSHLKVGRPFAVFSPYKEPLLETYMEVKRGGRAVMVTLSESWLRNYQVESGRTHPEVVMSGTGGYILTGTYVLNNTV